MTGCVARATSLARGASGAAFQSVKCAIRAVRQRHRFREPRGIKREPAVADSHHRDAFLTTIHGDRYPAHA